MLLEQKKRALNSIAALFELFMQRFARSKIQLPRPLRGICLLGKKEHPTSLKYSSAEGCKDAIYGVLQCYKLMCIFVGMIRYNIHGTLSVYQMKRKYANYRVSVQT